MSSSMVTPLGSYSPLSSDEEITSHRGSPVYFTTSLGTNFVYMVRRWQTVAEIKERLVRSLFPRHGEVKINAVKFGRGGRFSALDDSMAMSMILDESEDNLNLYVDASISVEHHEGQGQLLLNCAKGSNPEEDRQCNSGAIGWKQGDPQKCPDGHVEIAATSICLRGLDKDNVKQVDFSTGASSLGPRETDAKETSLEELPQNPLVAPERAMIANEQGDNFGEFIGVVGDKSPAKKRKKPTPKSRKQDPKSKRNMPEQDENSVSSFESSSRPKEVYSFLSYASEWLEMSAGVVFPTSKDLIVMRRPELRMSNCEL